MTRLTDFRQRWNLPLFPTAVVGSLPRPAWLLDMLERHSTRYVTDRREKELQTDWERRVQQRYHERPIGASELNRALDRAVETAIGLQEAAGIDIITDGELRRRSFTEVVCERVQGFSANRHAGWVSVVTEPLVRTGPIVTDEVQYLRRHTDKPIEITLPSPYLMTQRHWIEEHSKSAYPTRREFLEALIPIYRREIEELMALGVAVIQFDDPGLCLLVDDAFRANYNDPEDEIRMAVEGTNAVVDGMSERARERGVLFALHLCRAHRKRGIGGQGDYSRILDALLEIHVDRYVMEFAVPQAGGLDIFRGCRFPKERSLGMGVVDVRRQEIDDPDTIVARVEEALQYFEPQQITLNPDCGFAPGSTNPIQEEEAYRKLLALSEAARMLREKYA